MRKTQQPSVSKVCFVRALQIFTKKLTHTSADFEGRMSVSWKPGELELGLGLDPVPVPSVSAAVDDDGGASPVATVPEDDAPELTPVVDPLREAEPDPEAEAEELTAVDPAFEALILLAASCMADKDKDKLYVVGTSV